MNAAESWEPANRRTDDRRCLYGNLRAGLLLVIAKFRLSLGIETPRTLAFVVIVFGNQATTYTNRERRRIGSARPSLWHIGSSVVDLLIASVLATCGIAMAPLPIFLVGGILVAAAVFAVILDFAKVPVFNFLNIA
jgi:H+-transporting ATPase